MRCNSLVMLSYFISTNIGDEGDGVDNLLYSIYWIYCNRATADLSFDAPRHFHSSMFTTFFFIHSPAFLVCKL